MRPLFAPALLLAAAVALPAMGQGFMCEDTFRLDESVMECLRFGPEQQQPRPVKPPSFLERYAAMALRHRLSGEASYYSSFFDGRKTASGAVYYNARYSAAHLTLPLGCWIEVRSRATNKVIRLEVNDRGPYSGGFVLDLSRSAARALGVDVAADRTVSIRVIAMPGEKPPEENDQIAALESEEALTNEK